MTLTDQHVRYLTYVSRFRPTIRALSGHLGIRLSSASMMRNRLRDEGLICDWSNYEDRIEITDAGRSIVEGRL